MKYRSILTAALLLAALTAGRNAVAIAHDHTGPSTVTTGSPSSFTIPITASANTGILLWITVEDTNSITSVSGSITWSFIGFIHDTANARRLELWAGYSSGALSSATITMNLASAAVHQEAAIFDSYTGVRTTLFVEALNEVPQVSQAVFTGSVTTLHNNSLAVMTCTGAQGGATATSGYTVGTFLTGISNTTLATVYGNSVVASPSTVTPGWNPFAPTSGDTLSAALVDASIPLGGGNHFLASMGCGT